MDKSWVLKQLSKSRRPVALVLAVLLLLDGITTYMGLKDPNLVETNPLIVNLSKYLGEALAVTVKTAVGIGAVLFHEFVIMKKKHVNPLLANVFGHLVFVPMTAMYLFVVYNNVRVIFF